MTKEQRAHARERLKNTAPIETPGSWYHEDMPAALDALDEMEAAHDTANRHRIKALENAARAFESSTGIFSFACFCCRYKDPDNIEKCTLLEDEVCEDMENWEFDGERFAGDKLK